MDTLTYPGVKITFQNTMIYVDTHRHAADNLVLAQAALRAMFGEDVFDARPGEGSIFSMLAGTIEFYRPVGHGLQALEGTGL